jgi:hypothetical protein
MTEALIAAAREALGQDGKEFSDAEIVAAAVDGAPDGAMIFTDPGEFATLLDSIGCALRACGLAGPALDETLAASGRICLRAIERARHEDYQRRARLRLVE